jgi:cytochrome P450
MELPTLATLTPKTLAVLLTGVFVLYRLISSAVTSYRNHRFAVANGCRPPKRWYSGPYGLLEFRRFMKRASQGQHVEYMASRWDSIGLNTYVMNVFGRDSINTIESRNIQAILATNFKDYCLGDHRVEAFHALLGDGIFTLDGKGWEYSRALLRPQFSRDQVADVELLDVHVTRLLKLMLEKGGEVVDLQPWIFDLTLDSATEFLFGESANSLLTAEQDGFGHVFNQSLKWIMWKLRFRRLARVYSPKEMKEVNAAVHGFVDRYVDNALNRDKHPLPKELGQKYIFLDAVVADTKDRKVLRDQMLNILLAGRDTTAGLIGWTIYLLAWNPRVYKKLRSELEKAFGTGTPGVWKRPTFEGLKDVVYLRYVLNEGMFLPFPSLAGR